MFADDSQQNIQQLLRSLGATENYTGFAHTAYAVQLTIAEPERLCLITKRLYPDVAKRFGTNWKAVERNIRTVVSVIWSNNAPMLLELAGFPLASRPNNACFLAILANACTSGEFEMNADSRELVGDT